MLTQLFSDTDLLLKKVVFNSGINIVLGKYSDKEKKGINGIGKSSLVRLIGYCLLSNSVETQFLHPKYDFLRKEKHNIILEFSLENKSYFIKRTFEKNDLIFFGNSPDGLDSYTKSELKTILSNKFFPFEQEDLFFKGERLGTLLDFYIKDDLHQQRRSEPTNFSSGTSSANNKAIFNFFLLGLPTRNLISYKELAEEYDQYFNTVKGLEEKIKNDHGKSLEEFRSDRFRIEQNIALIEQSLNNYTFLDSYKKIETDLISLTGEINTQLKQYHSLDRKLKKIKESFQFNQEIDIRQVRRIYNETQAVIGDLLSRKIEEVLNFKKEIIESRNKFLVVKESELQKSINEILNSISKVEKKRSELYQLLDEKGALESIENAYERLTNEKTKLATNQHILKQIEELQEKLSELSIFISEVKRDILLDLKQNESTINELRILFLDILKNAIVLDQESTQGYFAISPRHDSNRNQLPFKIEVEIPKADALGQSRLKIVAYDLMVFIKNIISDKKYPRFLIHDGAYHSIALFTKIKALNYIYHSHLRYPHFQYIVSFNEDEVFIPDEKQELIGDFDFNLQDLVIAEYTDNPSEMIFKREF